MFGPATVEEEAGSLRADWAAFINVLRAGEERSIVVTIGSFVGPFHTPSPQSPIQTSFRNVVGSPRVSVCCKLVCCCCCSQRP